MNESYHHVKDPCKPQKAQAFQARPVKQKKVLKHPDKNKIVLFHRRLTSKAEASRKARGDEDQPNVRLGGSAEP